MDNVYLLDYLAAGMIPKKIYAADPWGIIVSRFILNTTNDKATREAYFPEYKIVDDSCIVGAPRIAIPTRYHLTAAEIVKIRNGIYEPLHQKMEKYITLLNQNPGYYLEFFSFMVDATLATDLSILDGTTTMH